MNAIQQALFDAQELTLSPSIEERLTSVLECLNSITNINHGGCGISALSIYRWCKKNGIEVSDRPFVVLCEDEWEKSGNDAHCEDGEVSEICIPHVVVEIDGELVDSTGRRTAYVDELPYRQVYQLDEDELLEIIAQPGWNDWFKRRQAIPVIEYGLGIDLSDVDLTHY